jgi:type VI protein secretion system component Hcp
MRPRTLLWVAVGIAAAVLGGATIWAAAGEGDSSRRQAVLEEGPTGPTTFSVTAGPEIAAGNPFSVSSYSVGASVPGGSSGSKASTAVQFEPLHFTRPLDERSLEFFSEATRNRNLGQVQLELIKTIGGKPEPVLRYEFSPSYLASGDETASNGQRATQAIAMAYGTLAIQVPTANVLGYARADESIGSLEIPGITSTSKPAYVLSYSWGWSQPGAEKAAAGTLSSGMFAVKSVTVERVLDGHAPWFWQQLIQGKPMTEMTLNFQTQASTEEGTKPAPYATYKLSNVHVGAVHDSGGETPVEQIRLDFTKIELTHGTNTQLFDPRAAQ